MCGITGIFDSRDRLEVDRTTLPRPNDSQLHRRGVREDSMHVEPGLRLVARWRPSSIIDVWIGHARNPLGKVRLQRI